MKRFLVIVVLLCFAFTGQAFAGEQFYKKEDLKTWDRDKVAGGEGTLSGKFSFTRHDAKPDEAIKEIGWMTLLPGHSIGMHKHENNEDAYIIVSGTGVFIGSDGKEIPVKAGDITIARKGEGHALLNTGKEPLYFLDIVAQQ
jgi:Mannose-6-phosphate isomerase